MSATIIPVVFHGDTVDCVRDADGTVWVVLAPVCARLGVEVTAQRRKLQEIDHVARVAKIATLKSDGHVFDQWAVDLDGLPAWLMSISLKRVAPDVRPLLKSYQADCSRVLRDYFFAGAALNPAATLEQKRATASLAVQRWVAEELEDHPALWNGPLVEALARLWRVRPKVEQAGGFPVGLLRAVQRVYRVVLGDDLYEAMRKKSGFGDDRDKRYNALREDGYLRLSRELGKVEILAQTSQSKREFKAKLESYFAGRPLQADLGWA